MNAEDIAIECSWTIENIEDVRNKILWKDDLCELTEETDVDNCFMVSQPDCSSAQCTLKFVLKNNRKFSCLQILSEVPMVEVYGQFEEYLSTHKGEQLDEVDGTYLYECKVDLKKLQSEVLLKFCKVKENKSLWIYGINAVTKLISSKPVSGTIQGPPAIGSNLMNPLLSSLMMGVRGNDKAIKTPLPSNSFEQLVDLKVKESEERIMKYINERLIQLENKFDKNCNEIINLLKELNNK